MNNPFRPGNGVIPPYLAGRERELKQFSRSLETALSLPRNLVISGIRGTGKTVLLREFEGICKKKRWLFARREFSQKLCKEGEFLNALLTDIITKTKGVSIAKELARPLIGFGPSRKAEPGADFVPQLIKRYHGTLGDRLEAILREVSKIINKAGFNGLALLYDEFHSIEDKKIKDNFPLSLLLESFSHLQQENHRFYLVLSGLPPLFPNLVKAKTYSERMFSVWHIDSLPRKPTEEAIVLPLKRSPWKFSKDLISRVIEETRGYPYFIQFYCYYLIDNIPKREIALKDFEEMQPFLLRELDESFFKGRFERASDAEREVILKIAGLGPELKSSLIRRKTMLSKGYLQQVLISLTEKGLIFRSGRGKYRFCLPLFEKFLLRQRKV